MVSSSVIPQREITEMKGVSTHTVFRTTPVYKEPAVLSWDSVTLLVLVASGTRHVSCWG